MRINTRAYFQSAITSVADIQRQLGEMTVALSSGKRVQRPSDDADASLLISRAHTEIGLCDARNQALQQGKRICGAIGTALDTITQSVNVAYDAALHGLGSNMAPNARQAEAAEIRAAADAIFTEANTRLQDRYLFGGYQETQPPFQHTAGTVQYMGDSNRLSVPGAPGSSIEVSIPGDELFNFDTPAGRAVPDVESNMFSLVNDLADAVESGHIDQGRQLMDDLNTLRSHVIALHGDTGAIQQRIETNISAIEETKLQYQRILEEEEDIDLAEAITRYTTTQTNYQALLAVLSDIMSMPTMFDRLA